MLPSPAMMTARSRALRSSRTLPGQSYFEERFGRFGREIGNLAVVLSIKVRDQTFRKGHQVVAAIPQRRQMDMEDVKAVVEVLAKMAPANGVVGDLIGGGHDAHIHLELGLAPEPAHLRILQHAQKLRLRRHRHFANLVKQQSSMLRQFEASGPALGGSGEGSLFVPEQFGLDQGFRKGRAVDRHKRSLPPRAERMDGASHHLFACSAFTRYQNARPTRRRLLKQCEYLLHARRTACEFSDRTLVLQLTFENLLLRAEPGKCSGAPEQHLQHIRLNRLLHVPERTELMHCAHRGLDIAESGEDDHRRHVAALAKGLQKPEPVETRHVHVGYDHVRMKLFHLLERAAPIRRRLGLHSPGFDHPGQSRALAAFVVNNQNIQSVGLICPLTSLILSVIPRWKLGGGALTGE